MARDLLDCDYILQQAREGNLNLLLLSEDARMELNRLVALNPKAEDLSEDEINFLRAVETQSLYACQLALKLEFLYARPEEVKTLLDIGQKRTEVWRESLWVWWAGLCIFVYKHPSQYSAAGACVIASSGVIARLYFQTLLRGLENGPFTLEGLEETLSIVKDKRFQNKSSESYSFWSLAGWDCIFGQGRQDYVWPPSYLRSQFELHELDRAHKIATFRDPFVFGVSQLFTTHMAWVIAPDFLKRSRPASFALASAYGFLVGARYGLECAKGTRQWRIGKHAEWILWDRKRKHSFWGLAGWRVFPASITAFGIPFCSVYKD